MAFTPERHDDLTNTTLNKFHKLKWQDLSLTLQEYVAGRLFDDEKVEYQGGTLIEFEVQTKNTGNAVNTGLFAQQTTNVLDVMTKGTVPWTKQSGSYGWDIDEPGFQSDETTIVRLMDVREHTALNDLAVLNEQNLWSAPTSTTDSRPMGIPFWVQKDASTTPAGAFQTSNPSGFTAGRAGLSSSTLTGWRNWAGGHSGSVDETLIQRIKTAMYKTTFVPPVPHPEVGWGKAQHEIFTVYSIREEMERRAESRNDNLGQDLAKYINAVTVGGVPVRAVPYLDANDTSEPLYGLNFRYLKPIVKSGAYLRRSGVLKGYDQPTVRKVCIDTWMNYICSNLRSQWVLSVA